MNEDILSSKEFFKTQRIPLSDEWLESCINWFLEQQEGAAYTQKELHCAVYEQWLLLDLREVELAQLPANIQRATKMVLNKTFSLQMMCITDIAKPKLQQLNKIKKSNLLTAGIEDGSESTDIANRMLQMTLTDGVQEIKAIEYQPVPVLHLKLAPGVKVRITGPVTVRRGQMMLEQHNVKILGGDVEDIMISHSVENVLSRCLNLPENPNPRNFDESITNTNEPSRSITQIPQQSIPQVPNVERKRTVQNNIQNYMSNTNHTNQNKSLPQNYITPEEEEEMRIAQEVDMLLEAERDIIQSTKKVTKPTKRKTPDIFEDDFNPDDIPEEPSSTVSLNQPTTSKQTKTEDIIDLDDDFFTSLEIDKHLDKIDEDRIYTLTEVCNLIRKKRVGKFTTYAKFKSIVQKLTVKDNAWHLQILVEADEAELAVKVDKDVITDMIGYTPLEVLEMKKDIQNKNPDTANIIMKAIDNFKTQLLEMNCLMQIEAISTEDIPSIIKFV